MYYSAVPAIAWQALPRVVPNANQLLDEFGNAGAALANDWNDLHRERFEATRAAVRAAMVVPVTAEIDRVIRAAWLLVNHLPANFYAQHIGSGNDAKALTRALTALEKKP